LVGYGTEKPGGGNNLLGGNRNKGCKKEHYCKVYGAVKYFHNSSSILPTDGSLSRTGSVGQ
jgi:hypothetical protein